jgi:ABC-type branched-subunit amino acid transport system ATPase component
MGQLLGEPRIGSSQSHANAVGKITALGAILSLIPFLLFWKGAQLRASSKQVQVRRAFAHVVQSNDRVQEVARLQEQLANREKSSSDAAKTKITVV